MRVSKSRPHVGAVRVLRAAGFEGDAKTREVPVFECCVLLPPVPPPSHASPL